MCRRQDCRPPAFPRIGPQICKSNNIHCDGCKPETTPPDPATISTTGLSPPSRCCRGLLCGILKPPPLAPEAQIRQTNLQNDKPEAKTRGVKSPKATAQTSGCWFANDDACFTSIYWLIWKWDHFGADGKKNSIPRLPHAAWKKWAPPKNRCYFYTSGSIYVSGPCSIIPPLFAKTGPVPSVLEFSLVSLFFLEHGARRRR